MRSVIYLCFITTVYSACPQVSKFYVNCGSSLLINETVAFCNGREMSILNFTNSSTTTLAMLAADIIELNNTLVNMHCTSSWWYASGNKLGLAANSSNLIGNVSAILSAALTGVLDDLVGGLLGGVLDLVGDLLCGLLGCPATTTPAPPNYAIVRYVTVCTKAQKLVQQKCLTPTIRSDMRSGVFSDTKTTLYAGVYESSNATNGVACASRCMTLNTCVDTCIIDLTDATTCIPANKPPSVSSKFDVVNA
ncbi:unnamed protein product, partial [Didymodactylos carnosus]